ncbi:major facilitator superfamily domain-containing protein [Chytriomyces sp. MP71]|nr:major facilitator superfamily domain-containing protein [Chytriomyces sp. MP71]
MQFRPQKYTALVGLACSFLLFGDHFAYDTPAALNSRLQSHLGIGYAEWQYVLSHIYVAYSAPNTILPFFGGWLVDRVGARSVILAAAFLNLLGQALFHAGIMAKDTTVMIAGRLFFGIGGEGLGVAQACFVAQLFSRGEPNAHSILFIMGLNLSVSSSGTILTTALSPLIDKFWGLNAALSCATATCIFSFCSALFLFYVTRASDVCGSSDIMHFPEDPARQAHHSDDDSDSGSTTFAQSRGSVPHFPISPPLTLSPTPSEADSVSHLSPSLNERTPLLSTRIQIHTASTLPCTILPSCSKPGGFNFQASFWVICLLFALFQGTKLSFNNTASDFLMTKWYHNDTVSAGLAMSVPAATATTFLVIASCILESNRFGCFLLILAFTLLAICHTILGLTTWMPIPTLFCMGMAEACCETLIWPTVARVVEVESSRSHLRLLEERAPIGIDCPDGEDWMLNGSKCAEDSLGTAYGTATSLMNVALVIIPLIGAWIVADSGGGWLLLELFYSSLCVVGVLASLWLWQWMV